MYVTSPATPPRDVPAYVCHGVFVNNRWYIFNNYTNDGGYSTLSPFYVVIYTHGWYNYT